jgi:hypothetical protein
LRGFNILRPFIQFGCFSGALFISLTRIADYRHHPIDVIAGILVGLFFASLTLLFITDLFNRPRLFQVKYEQLRRDPDTVDAVNPEETHMPIRKLDNLENISLCVI